MRSKAAVAAAVAAALAVIAGVVVFVLGGDDGPSGAEAAADAYLAAWTADDVAAMGALIENPAPDFADQHARIVRDLQVRTAEFRRTTTSKDGEATVVAFRADLQLAGLGPWSYDGSLSMRHVEDRWLVQWSPATVHPQLGAGESLVRTRDRPDRGQILGAGDEPLALAVPVVKVGIEPRRMTDQAEVERVLNEQLGVAATVVQTELGRPSVQPDHFVPIVTVRRERYDQVKPIIYPVPGLVFQEGFGRDTVVPGFGAAVLGRTGEVTAELLDEFGTAYQAGDVVGLTGLERVFERELAGTPSGDVHIEDAAGTTRVVLATYAGEAPRPLRTTISRPVQEAAEAALVGVEGQAALVAVDSSGNVVAAASRPVGDDFNRAFAGTYPPGSTFKVVTGTALLENGVDASSPMSCPPTLNVDGRSFRNFEGEAAAGTITFADAMAISCNTAFIDAASKLPDGALVKAAEQFGFNTSYALGLDSAGGGFPAPESAVEQAAAAIGQGRVTTSVVHLASVIAAVGSGTWKSPVLLPERVTDQESRTLPPGVAPAIADLLRGVVDHGTGTPAAVAGRDVAGKTGTAEFGTDNPPRTHAWFAGLGQGIGAAVLVEDGGVGGEIAAPIAARFFTALP